MEPSMIASNSSTTPTTAQATTATTTTTTTTEVVAPVLPEPECNDTTTTATTAATPVTPSATTSSAEAHTTTPNATQISDTASSRVQVFEGEFDDEGVYFYQAFNDKIAEYALKHQTFGGPYFNPQRMTWIKPSFAWVLYRSGYGYKKNQTRILKVKLSHDTVATILSRCTCFEAGWRGGSKIGECADGRIQWDPARDLYSADKKVPRKMLSTRAIQIGVARSLSSLYVESILKITDVTQLAHQVCVAHRMRKRRKAKELMEDLKLQLPVERPYLPQCEDHVLKRLGMLPGKGARALAQIGRGMVTLAPRPVAAPTKHGGEHQQKNSTTSTAKSNVVQTTGDTAQCVDEDVKRASIEEAVLHRQRHDAHRRWLQKMGRKTDPPDTCDLCRAASTT